MGLAVDGAVEEGGAAEAGCEAAEVEVACAEAEAEVGRPPWEVAPHRVPAAELDPAEELVPPALVLPALDLRDLGPQVLDPARALGRVALGPAALPARETFAFPTARRAPETPLARRRTSRAPHVRVALAAIDHPSMPGQAPALEADRRSALCPQGAHALAVRAPGEARDRARDWAGTWVVPERE